MNLLKNYGLATALILAAPAAQAATITIPQSALVADGNYYTNNIGTSTLARNDDGSTGLINLGFTLTFFGADYNSLYVNNNGNVSFGAPISAYVPSGPTGANAPLISAWFGDVDTRAPASGLVHYQLDTVGQLVVTWDNVGRYASRGDLLNSFQMVIRGNDYAVPVGEGQIGFFYKSMPWESTDTSQTAAIGFGNGAGDAVVLEGSTAPGLNQIVADHHIWFNQNLTPVTPVPSVPEPATWAMMLAGFGMIGAALRYRRRSTKLLYS